MGNGPALPIPPDCSVTFFVFFDIAGFYMGNSLFARHGELVTLSASGRQKVGCARKILKPEADSPPLLLSRYWLEHSHLIPAAAEVPGKCSSRVYPDQASETQLAHGWRVNATPSQVE